MADASRWSSGGLAVLPGERLQAHIMPTHGTPEPAAARPGAPSRCSYVAPSVESARSPE